MKTKRVIKAKAQVQPVVMLNRSMIEKACRDLSSLNISLNHMGEINLSALTVSSLRVFSILLSST